MDKQRRLLSTLDARLIEQQLIASPWLHRESRQTLLHFLLDNSDFPHSVNADCSSSPSGPPSGLPLPCIALAQAKEVENRLWMSDDLFHAVVVWLGRIPARNLNALIRAILHSLFSRDVYRYCLTFSGSGGFDDRICFIHTVFYRILLRKFYNCPQIPF